MVICHLSPFTQGLSVPVTLDFDSSSYIALSFPGLANQGGHGISSRTALRQTSLGFTCMILSLAFALILDCHFWIMRDDPRYLGHDAVISHHSFSVLKRRPFTTTTTRYIPLWSSLLRTSSISSSPLQATKTLPGLFSIAVLGHHIFALFGSSTNQPVIVQPRWGDLLFFTVRQAGRQGGIFSPGFSSSFSFPSRILCIIPRHRNPPRLTFFSRYVNKAGFLIVDTAVAPCREGNKGQ